MVMIKLIGLHARWVVLRTSQGRHSYDDHVRQSVYGQHWTPNASRIPSMSAHHYSRWIRQMIEMHAKQVSSTDYYMQHRCGDGHVGKVKYTKHNFHHQTCSPFSGLSLPLNSLLRVQFHVTTFTTLKVLRYPSLSASFHRAFEDCFHGEGASPHVFEPLQFTVTDCFTVLLLFLPYVYKRNMNVLIAIITHDISRIT